MESISGITFSQHLMNHEDQYLLDIGVFHSNRVLSRSTGYVIFICPFSESTTESLDDHVRNEIALMVGRNNTDKVSQNFITCIRYALVAGSNIVVFDEDCSMPQETVEYVTDTGSHVFNFIVDDEV